MVEKEYQAQLNCKSLLNVTTEAGRQAQVAFDLMTNSKPKQYDRVEDINKYKVARREAKSAMKEHEQSIENERPEYLRRIAGGGPFNPSKGYKDQGDGGEDKGNAVRVRMC
jgi:hypothetical protein